jgi:hypothetical protein
MELKEIKILGGSSHCQYSMLENQLKVVTENQKILYDILVYIKENIDFKL